MTRRRRNLICAALRHMSDAEHLADEASPNFSLDQARHLAGYGPECARKALLSVRWADKALGHDFGGDNEDILAVIVALDPHAARYDPSGWTSRYGELPQWKPDCRYDRTGTADSTRTQELVRQARCAVDETVLALWTDGVLEGDELR